MTVDPLTGYSFDHRQIFASRPSPAPDESFAGYYQAEIDFPEEADGAGPAAGETSDYSNFARLRNPDNPWRGLPGGEYAVSSPNRVTGEIVPTSDMVRYEEYFRQIHDEVVSELGLEVNTLKAGSPETLNALKQIGQRIMADPEGQRHITQLGLNHLNHVGLPTSEMPALDGKPATTPNPRFNDIARAVRARKEIELMDSPDMREVRLDRPPSSLPAKSLLQSRYAAY